MRRNSGIVLVLFLLWGSCVLAAQGGGHAAAEVVYAVYNESQGTYFTGLQEALDEAQKGDVLRVVVGGISFNGGLYWKTDGITVDLNGATITAPPGQPSISVMETVDKLELRNGILKTSDLATNGIEVLGDTSSPLEIKLENMKIYGKRSVYFNRNGELEWHGGEASGTEYGVFVDPSVQNFAGSFTGVTFRRSTGSAIYFGGREADRPVTAFSVVDCRFGEAGNPLAGAVLWVEAGTTTVEMKSCTVEAGGSAGDLIRVWARGSVTVADSRLHRDRGAAVNLKGVTEGLLVGNEVTTRAGYQNNAYSPALWIESSRCAVRANRLTGPGTQGVRVIGDRVEFQDNYIAGFADGAYLEQAAPEVVNNIVTASVRGIVLRNVAGGLLRGNEVTGPQGLKAGTGIWVQGGSSLELIDNGIQGWSTGLMVHGVDGIRVAGSIFRDNGVGARLGETAGAVLENSLWEGNGTGLVVSGEGEADIRDNILTANGTAMDLASLTGGRFQCSRNDLYGNTLGVQAPSVITVAVPLNYWGSSSGPHHEVLNPEGRGEIIRGNLDFVPWSPYAYRGDDRPPEVALSLPAGIWREREPLPLEISVGEELLLDRVELVVYGPRGQAVGSRLWWGDEWVAQTQILEWETADLEDGSYCFRISAVDGKGNTGRAEGCVLLDRHPPSRGWIYINGGEEKTSSLTVELTLGAEDVSGIAEMMVRNEEDAQGEWEPYRPVRIWELSPGPAGLRRVIVRFRDGAGWVSEEIAAGIVFDPGHSGGGEHGETEEGDKPGGEGPMGGKKNPGKGEFANEHKPQAGRPSDQDASGGIALGEESSEDTGGIPAGEGGREDVINFSDVPEDHWARSDIVALISRGLFPAAQGEFFPTRPLTRGELAALVDRILMLPPGPQGDSKEEPPASPFGGAVARVAASGIMVGYEDGSFRAGSPVSRQEAAAVLSRTARKRGMNHQGGRGVITFTDLEEVAAWAYGDVLWAANAGLLQGYPDGTFRPRSPLSRAEAAALFRRLLDLTLPAEQGFNVGQVPGRLPGP
ncbi:MAG: S-layer domain-containing protein [Moorella sp. 60_41]|nr:MAG: S-layer domain-containing protein [Moorella sp. 60_41]